MKDEEELVRKHYRGDVDYFAVYSPDLQKTYLIPITDVGDTMNALRLVPTKNNQAKHVRWPEATITFLKASISPI